MNDIIELLKIGDSFIDENGFEVSNEISTEIFADKKSIRSKEFYEAQSSGFKLDLMFIVKPYEYDNQTMIRYEGNKYKVERTYEKDTENLEIICSRIV